MDWKYKAFFTLHKFVTVYKLFTTIFRRKVESQQIDDSTIHKHVTYENEGIEALRTFQ